MSAEAIMAVTAAEELKPRIVERLRTIFDPEIPVNIYDLGLVYAIEVYGGGRVRILMTLTTAGCPVAEEFPAEVERVVRTVEGVSDVEVEIVWEPPWSPERLNEAQRLELGMW
jgi:FeS assembly SUF system protein